MSETTKTRHPKVARGVVVVLIILLAACGGRSNSPLARAARCQSDALKALDSAPNTTAYNRAADQYTACPGVTVTVAHAFDSY